MGQFPVQVRAPWVVGAKEGSLVIDWGGGNEATASFPVIGVMNFWGRELCHNKILEKYKFLLPLSCLRSLLSRFAKTIESRHLLAHFFPS